MLEPVQSQAHRGLQEGIHQRHLLGGVADLVNEGTAEEEKGSKKNIRNYRLIIMMSDMRTYYI